MHKSLLLVSAGLALFLTGCGGAVVSAGTVSPAGAVQASMDRAAAVAAANQAASDRAAAVQLVAKAAEDRAAASAAAAQVLAAKNAADAAVSQAAAGAALPSAASGAAADTSVPTTLPPAATSGGLPPTASAFDRQWALTVAGNVLDDIKTIDYRQRDGIAVDSGLHLLSTDFARLMTVGPPPGLDPATYLARVTTLRSFSSQASAEIVDQPIAGAARYTVVRHETGLLLSQLNGALGTHLVLP